MHDLNKISLERTDSFDFDPPVRKELPDNNFINLESRRYIGNKSKLIDWIFETIKSETKNVNSLFDAFAGTGIVSKTACRIFDKVIVNDLLHSNNVIYNAFFDNGKWDLQKVTKIIKEYNSIEANNIQDNYFSVNFGGKFYDSDSSKLIGHIRDDIERKKAKLTKKEYNLLLASLIYSMDKIANTVGHFDAYIKKPIKPKKLNLRLIHTADTSKVKIYREDANILAAKVKADIAYIDPPYNSRQYNRFYHIYETLVKWDSPELFGVALKPKPEDSSVYCTVAAKAAFSDLVNKLKVKYLAVSYNNTYSSKSSSSENKIKLEEIENILNTKGKTKVFENSHKCFNTGKTEFSDHKEFLFITEVNG